MPLLHTPAPTAPGPPGPAPLAELLATAARRSFPQWSLTHLCPAASFQACPWAHRPWSAPARPLSPWCTQPSFSYSEPLGAPMPRSPARRRGPLRRALLVPQRGAHRPGWAIPWPPTDLWFQAPHGGGRGPQILVITSSPLPLNRKTSVPHSPSPQAPSSPPTFPRAAPPYGFPPHLGVPPGPGYWAQSWPSALPCSPLYHSLQPTPLLRFGAKLSGVGSVDLGHPGPEGTQLGSAQVWKKPGTVTGLTPGGSGPVGLREREHLASRGRE